MNEVKNREDFQKQYFETVVFNDLKDSYFPGIKYIREKYGDLGIDCWEVYRRVVDYRIKKYGNSYMINPKDFPFKTKDEILNDAKSVNKARKRMLDK